MKATIEIDLEELIEYRKGLDKIISRFKGMNERFEERKKKALESGYSEEVFIGVMNIMFGED